VSAEFYTIYKTINLVNGKYYYGKHQTTNVNDDYLGSGLLIGRAIKKYGIDNFKKTVLYIFDNEQDMNNKESELITEGVVCDSNNYNIALGGQGGNLGTIVNKKIGIKMSQILSGVPKTVEHKKALSISMKGIKQDPNVVSQRVATWKENIDKLTQVERNERFGLKGNRNGFYGKEHTEETKQKIRDTIGDSRKGSNNGNATTIALYGITYKTHKECMESLNLTKRQLKQIKLELNKGGL
jgi:hypothetical protein